MSAPAAIAFTDLDGTLLAHDTYDWRAAAPALEALRARQVPLVFASSKTRREIQRWRARLGNTDPFIAENGGALFLPEGWPDAPPAGAVAADGLEAIAFGAPYPRLREALVAIARESGLALRGFGDMTPAEIGARTGLGPDDVEAARAREYDEPFVVEGPVTEAAGEALRAAAGRVGLAITRGGRFHHLVGANDKGRAARALLDRCAAGGVRPRSLAAGDSANDLELLQVVEQPIVVARPGGAHAPELREALPHARFTRGIGPGGFAEGVLAVLGAWEAGAAP